MPKLEGGMAEIWAMPGFKPLFFISVVPNSNNIIATFLYRCRVSPLVIFLVCLGPSISVLVTTTCAQLN